MLGVVLQCQCIVDGCKWVVQFVGQCCQKFIFGLVVFCQCLCQFVVVCFVGVQCGIGQFVVGYVCVFDEYVCYVVVLVFDGLVDEVYEVFVYWFFGVVLVGEFCVFGDVGLVVGIYVVQQLLVILFYCFG